MALAMMRPLAAALVLLFSVSVSTVQAHEGSDDILWQIRPPDFIWNLGIRARKGPAVIGFAWHGQEPCIIMTPDSPPETAPEPDIRKFLKILNHEKRHCREGNFHE